MTDEQGRIDQLLAEQLAPALSQRTRPQVPVASMAEQAAAYAKANMGAPAARQRLGLPQQRRPWRVWRPAFLVAACAMGGAAFLLSRSGERPGPGVHAASLAQHVTTRGQTARFTLPDGTVVQLNAESRLSVSDSFGGTTRAVHLEGEALLTVAPGATPFLVTGGGVTTRVLGTVFSVRCYPGEAGMQVVVAEGKVSVHSHSASAASAILAPGEMARVGAAGNLTVQRQVPVSDYMGWVEGRFTYQGTPLRDVLTEMSRVFNADIRVPNAALGNTPVRTAVHTRERLSDVLSSLALSVGARLERIGEAYVLVPQRGSTASSSYQP